MQFWILFILFPYLCSPKYCPLIIAENDDELDQFEDCTLTNAVHIHNSEVTRLTGLRNIKKIIFDPLVSRTGAAVFIVGNSELKFTDCFNSLTQVVFKGPERLHRAFMIFDNLFCLDNAIYAELIRISGGKSRSRMQPCACSFDAISRGDECSEVKESVIITESNYQNDKMMRSLQKVEVIIGSLIIANTKLREITFDKLRSIQNYECDGIPTLVIANNFWLKSITFPSFRDRQSYKFCNKESFLYSSSQQYFLIENNTQLHSTENLITTLKSIRKLHRVKDENREKYIGATDRDIPEAALNCSKMGRSQILNGTICTFKTFLLTEESQKLLRYCAGVVADVFIINESTTNIDWSNMNKIYHLDGCLVIENSSLTTLEHLSFDVIHNCNQEFSPELVRINNNSELKDTRFRFAISSSSSDSDAVGFSMPTNIYDDSDDEIYYDDTYNNTDCTPEDLRYLTDPDFLLETLLENDSEDYQEYEEDSPTDAEDQSYSILKNTTDVPEDYPLKAEKISPPVEKINPIRASTRKIIYSKLVAITNNKKLCEGEINATLNLTKLRKSNNLSYLVYGNSDQICEENHRQELKLDLSMYFIGLLVLIVILISGLWMVIKFLLHPEANNMMLVQKFCPEETEKEEETSALLERTQPTEE